MRKAISTQHPSSDDPDRDSPVPDIEDDCDLPPDLLNTSIDDCSTFAGNHHAAVKDLQHVKKLYSCIYPLKEQPRNCRVPKGGWKSESPTLDPPPTCTWFPPAKRSSKSSSMVVAGSSGLSLSLTKPSLGNSPKKITAAGESVASYSTSGSFIHSNTSIGDQSQTSSALQVPAHLESILHDNYITDEAAGDEASLSSGIQLGPSS